MMQLLGSCPDVVFDRIYAYENAYLSYFLTLAAVPLEGKIKVGPWRRAALDHIDFVTKHGAVGGMPWRERPSVTMAGGTFEDDLFMSMWTVFSDRATAYGRSLDASHDGTPRYYAETAPVWVADRSRRLLRGKTIYLARDPRDQWVSIMAFNERRGRPSFGMQPSDTPESFADAFAARQREFLHRILEVAESDLETVVRFEELTTRRASTAERLSSWLGVELSALAADDHRAKHVTSTHADYRPRWPDEMPNSVVDIFRTHLYDEISEMGWGWNASVVHREAPGRDSS